MAFGLSSKVELRDYAIAIFWEAFFVLMISTWS